MVCCGVVCRVLMERERVRESYTKLPYIDRHLNSVNLTLPAGVTFGLNQTKSKWPPLPLVQYLGISCKGVYYIAQYMDKGIDSIVLDALDWNTGTTSY